LNFVSFGAVGGDLFKAVFIAKDQRGRRTEAVATVVVDRLVGFYALLVVASVAILLAPPQSVPAVRTVCNMALLVTALGGVGVAVLLWPGFTSGRLARSLQRLPRVGDLVARLMASLQMYRDKPLAMLGIFAMAMFVHVLLCFSLYLVGSGLSSATPTLAEHFIIVPLSMVAGGLPFTPAGLGTFEFAMDALYGYVPARSTGVAGVLVALAYRVITIAVAGVGVVYYWTCRSEIRQVLKDAEQSGEAEGKETPQEQEAFKDFS
jgi:uncharacterized membrane protein YbhN (UPF0104 family)